MKLELITLLGEKLNELVYEVMLPTQDGDIAVFPGHEALVSLARPGVLGVRKNKGDADNKIDYFAITGGVIEVTGERVRVLVDAADTGDDISESQSKAALETAEKLRSEAKSQIELENAAAIIAHQQARLRVAALRGRHH